MSSASLVFLLFVRACSLSAWLNFSRANVSLSPSSIRLPNRVFRLGMAASVDANSIRGVSDLISAHMTQSTTMDVNLANHITEGTVTL